MSSKSLKEVAYRPYVIAAQFLAYDGDEESKGAQVRRDIEDEPVLDLGLLRAHQVGLGRCKSDLN